MLYAIADRVVDDYAAAIDGLANDIDEVEAEVFSARARQPGGAHLPPQARGARVPPRGDPALAPMQRLASRQTGLPLDPRTGDYFRDVHDHLVRDSDRIAAFDELLAGVLQANLAQLTVRDNQDMRRISAWIAIIAVPTMVFGMYGMNFEYMPELEWRYGYPAVVVAVLAICAGLHRRFQRAGWL